MSNLKQFRSIREARLKHKEASAATPLGLRVANALITIIAAPDAAKIAVPTAFAGPINKAFEAELVKRDIEIPDTSFIGFIEGVIKSTTSLPPNSYEELEQVVLTKFFAPNSKGMYWFDLYKERYEGKFTVLQEMKKAIRGWVLNWIRDTNPNEAELADAPTEDDYNPNNLGQMIFEEEDIIDQLGSQQLLDDITTALAASRLGDVLVVIFKMLMDGWTKREITDELEFKSMSRLSYYITQMKPIVKQVFEQHDRQDLLSKISAKVTEDWDDPKWKDGDIGVWFDLEDRLIDEAAWMEIAQPIYDKVFGEGPSTQDNFFQADNNHHWIMKPREYYVFAELEEYWGKPLLKAIEKSPLKGKINNLWFRWRDPDDYHADWKYVPLIGVADANQW